MGTSHELTCDCKTQREHRARCPQHLPPVVAALVSNPAAFNRHVGQAVVRFASLYARPARRACGGRRRSSFCGRRRPGRRAASRSAGGGSSGDPGEPEPGEPARRADRHLALAPPPKAVLTFAMPEVAR
jgi:hypothetical protein